MKALNVIGTAYRGTLEEQDDTIVWITHAMKGAGADLDVLLRRSAVNYASKAQEVPALRFGDRRQKNSPHIAQDVAGLIGKDIAVYIIEEDIVEHGLVGRAQFAITPKPATSWAITNKHRQKVGDIYNPDHNRRLQIRNNHRQIIGYIERDGTVTNTSRQLWVPKTLSTAEKWGFGLKKEGFSNWGTRTEWPLSKVKSSGAKLADEVLRTSRNSSAKSNDSNFRDPHLKESDQTPHVQNRLRQRAVKVKS
jgi:hypothetical protein